MARTQVYLELDGPLFERDAIERMQDAIADGIEEMGERGAAIMQGITYAAGFEHTGRFAASVESDFRRQRGAGYAKIAPTAVWPQPDRPTRTWAERGTRRGVKLRKGLGIFRKSATMTRKAVDYDMFASRITEALS